MVVRQKSRRGWMTARCANIVCEKGGIGTARMVVMAAAGDEFKTRGRGFWRIEWSRENSSVGETRLHSQALGELGVARERLLEQLACASQLPLDLGQMVFDGSPFFDDTIFV